MNNQMPGYYPNMPYIPNQGMNPNYIGMDLRQLENRISRLEREVRRLENKINRMEQGYNKPLNDPYNTYQPNSYNMM